MRQYTTKGKKITVEANDVEMALNRISKKKATGIDNITLAPIDKKKTLKIKINNETYEDH